MAKGDGASNDAAGPAFRPGASSVPLTSSKWPSEVTIGDVTKRVLEKSQHQPPILIRDSAVGVFPGAVTGVMGAVHNGKIYLFRDLLRSKAEEARTLFHKLPRCGLRRLLTKEQFAMFNSHLGAGVSRAVKRREAYGDRFPTSQRGAHLSEHQPFSRDGCLILVETGHLLKD